jgi:hypothetical protein
MLKALKVLINLRLSIRSISFSLLRALRNAYKELSTLRRHDKDMEINELINDLMS